MSVVSRQWKILELIKTTENLFKEKGIPDPRLSTELLLARTLGIERIDLYLDFDKPLTESELEDFRTRVRRRLSSEPLQYIMGEAHFYGLRFMVNPSVLIPRPETELLVEKTLEVITQKDLTDPKILEIGTGSGCISISIACNCECTIDAVDINEESIQTAKYNLERNTPKGIVNFLKCDFLKEEFDFNNYDIIVSNPPYVPVSDFPLLSDEIKNYEPEHALTDGADGLEFYRKILSLYTSALKKPFVLIEIGDGRKDAVEELIKQNSVINYRFHKDLINIFRVVEF